MSQVRVHVVLYVLRHVGRKNSSGGIIAATSCRLVTQRLLLRRQGYRRYVSISPLKKSHELDRKSVV